MKKFLYSGGLLLYGGGSVCMANLGGSFQDGRGSWGNGCPTLPGGVPGSVVLLFFLFCLPKYIIIVCFLCISYPGTECLLLMSIDPTRNSLYSEFRKPWNNKFHQFSVLMLILFAQCLEFLEELFLSRTLNLVKQTLQQLD